MDIPIVMTAAGLVPIPPEAIRAALILAVEEQVPGYTANLPGSLIEDVASTDTLAIVQCDQAKVELVNSLTPYGANLFLLHRLGAIYGVQRGLQTNTTVDVIFTGTPGFVISRGFTVSDGVHQYTVEGSNGVDGAIIGSGGESDFVYCVATQEGNWSVPESTVNQVVTSVPSGVVLTVNNPLNGTPGTGPQTAAAYRAQVLQAGLATATGLPTLLRTAISRVSGVPDRLVSIRQRASGWEVIAGGGDPYQVAYAIFASLFNIASLVGSTDVSRNETVSIDDYPDSYEVVFVRPPEQTVGVGLTWNTSSPNFINPISVAQLGQAALADYVNAVVVGQPLNVFEMESVFKAAISGIVPGPFVSRMIFSITIDSVVTPPDAGTGLVYGDPEGYFFTTTTDIVITQG